MATVHLLYGLPGTGKTTFARKLQSLKPAVLLNHDELMVSLHGIDPPAADFARYADEVSEALWALAARHVADGKDVVLDWGFWTRTSRDQARQRVKGIGAAWILYRMVCTNNLARKRTIERTKLNAAGTLVITGETWDVLSRRFQPLGPDEECDDIDGAS